jgi:hypothetical protein
VNLDYWNLIITLVAFFLALLIALYSWRPLRSFAVAVLGWFTVAVVLSSRGFFQDASGWTDGDITGFFVFGTLMSLPMIGLAVGWIRSQRLRDFLKSIPLSFLIGIEVYRVAGAIFWWLYSQKMIPPAIGIFTGFADVFIGITALPLAWVLGKGIPGTRQIAIVWNIFGISDFVIAVSVVSLSIFGLVTMTPDPVRIGLHPLALIALFQLPLSIAIHLLALRKLVMEERSPAWQLS